LARVCVSIFVQSGVPNTVAGLQATAAAMGNVQKQLIVALRDLTDRDSGVAAEVESANHYLVQTLEHPTKPLDAILHEFKTDLFRVWIPLATASSPLIGLFAGVVLEDCGVKSSQSSQVPSQERTRRQPMEGLRV
jgi:hypothetical protein